MSKVAQLLMGAVVAQVRGVDEETKLALSDAMSYLVEGYEHSDAFKSRGWDGRSTLFSWAESKFPIGFSVTAETILKSRGYTVHVARKPLPGPLGPMPTQENPLVDNFPPNPDYDYQFRAPKLLERHGFFTARVATGGGKSRLARLCIKRIGRKTLFLTTRTVLLYQFGKDCEAAGLKVSYVGDSEWDTSGDVVLAMVPTLSQRLQDFKDPGGLSDVEYHAALDRHRERRQTALELLGEIEFVIGEEAHESGSNSFYDVLKACRSALYRLALTATPLMRDGESNMRLIGMFGPIRLEISEKELIDRGILAKPYFKYVKSMAPPNVRRGTAWQKAEVEGIVRNVHRNRLVAAEVIRANMLGMTSMVLVKRKEHGELIASTLRRAGIRVQYIFGDSSKEKREKCLRMLQEGKLDCLIGSTILDVGVDVPAIGLLVLAGGGKAEVGIRQRIGRVLRRKKSGPNVSFVVDFSDLWNTHLSKHSHARRSIVEGTAGFKEGILATNDDFPFSALGFSRVQQAIAA